MKTLAKRGCRFISLEMSNGMMREDIMLATGCDVELVNSFGGNLIRLEQVVHKIKEAI